jgi:hypothetical protein
MGEGRVRVPWIQSEDAELSKTFLPKADRRPPTASIYILISIAAATLRQPAIISSNCLNVIDW